MKRQLILVLVLLVSPYFYAQNGPIDFEIGGIGADWTWTVFENDSNPTLEIVTNPDISGENTSSTVAKFTALQAGMPFAGCETSHGSGTGTFTISSTNNTIKIMVWKSVISDVGIKLVDATSWSLGQILVANTVVDQWEELTFDFSSHEGITYDQLVIFPDFDARTQDNIIYFDNIAFEEQVPLEEPMSAAPDPTLEQDLVISMFSNVYDDVPVDTWLTPWSVASISDIQIDGNDTKKYSNLDFAGIETVGPNLIDASAMEYFHMDVWTPNINTFRVKLVDFGADAVFGGGDDSEHEIALDGLIQNEWVSLLIPMSDFAGLNASDNIAQMIISSADPIGSGVVYVDNVYFSKLPSGVENFAPSLFNIFPNPSSETIFLESTARIEMIEIFALSGKLINSYASAERIDVSDLERGVYIVKARIENVFHSQKFVKL